MSTQIQTKREADVQIFKNKSAIFVRIGHHVYSNYFGKENPKILDVAEVEEVKTFSVAVLVFKFAVKFLTCCISLEINENGHFILSLTSPPSSDSFAGVSLKLPDKEAFQLLKYLLMNSENNSITIDYVD